MRMFVFIIVQKDVGGGIRASSIAWIIIIKGEKAKQKYLNFAYISFCLSRVLQCFNFES